MKEKVIPYRPRRNLPRIFLLLVIGWCLFTAVALYMGQAITYLKAKNELKSLELRLEKVQAENEYLREEIVLLQDYDYVEIKARELLGLVRPGETIFFVVD